MELRYLVLVKGILVGINWGGFVMVRRLLIMRIRSEGNAIIVRIIIHLHSSTISRKLIRYTLHPLIPIPILSLLSTLIT